MVEQSEEIAKTKTTPPMTMNRDPKKNRLSQNYNCIREKIDNYD